jgi:hypothetical protein
MTRSRSFCEGRGAGLGLPPWGKLCRGELVSELALSEPAMGSFLVLS